MLRKYPGFVPEMGQTIHTRSFEKIAEHCFRPNITSRVTKCFRIVESKFNICSNFLSKCHDTIKSDNGLRPRNNVKIVVEYFLKNRNITTIKHHTNLRKFKIITKGPYIIWFVRLYFCRDAMHII